MKASELRSRTVAELREEIHSLLRQQFNLRMQRGAGQLARPHEMRDVRRAVARAKTILNEKLRAGEGS